MTKVEITVLESGRVTISNDGREVTLKGVHRPERCEGQPCVIHNPSDHHMRDWWLYWRNDRGIFERLCEHDVGHPDPDQFDFWRATDQEWQIVHGCDFCCVKEER